MQFPRKRVKGPQFTRLRFGLVILSKNLPTSACLRQLGATAQEPEPRTTRAIRFVTISLDPLRQPLYGRRKLGASGPHVWTLGNH